MYVLVLTSTDAAAVIGGMLTALVTGIFVYLANRKTSGAVVRNEVIDPDMTKVGDIPLEVVTRRFEILERMHLWTLVVLVGQGFGFLLFALHIRQEGITNFHRTNDRLDLIQLELKGERRRH